MEKQTQFKAKTNPIKPNFKKSLSLLSASQRFAAYEPMRGPEVWE